MEESNSDIWWAVFAYSEWLDVEQNLLGDPDDDGRSHEDLVNQFFAEQQQAD